MEEPEGPGKYVDLYQSLEEWLVKAGCRTRAEIRAAVNNQPYVNPYGSWFSRGTAGMLQAALTWPEEEWNKAFTIIPFNEEETDKSKE